MDIAHFFTGEETIVGLEVHDAHVRVAVLERSNDHKAPHVIECAEEMLAEGIIEEGEIRNERLFVEALLRLKKKTRTKMRYAIVSLGAHRVYSRIFSFPESMRRERVEEAMHLSAGFHLPYRPEEVYLDWEPIHRKGDRTTHEHRKGEHDENEIFLAVAPKRFVDPYVMALLKAGISAVAVEFHPVSIARAIAVPEKETFMVLIVERNGVTISIVSERAVHFTRVLPRSHVEYHDLIIEETRRIIDFYEAEHRLNVEMILTVDDGIEYLQGNWPVPIRKADVKEFFKKNDAVKEDGNRWLAALGAAMRGILPRAEDDVISLLPVGTEEAYEHRKAVIFAEFLSNLSVGLSVLLVAAFAGVWLMMIYMQTNLGVRFAEVSALPPSPDAAQLRVRTESLNGLAATLEGVMTKIPRWSIALEEIGTTITKNDATGISIENISVPSPEGLIAIRGVALNRDVLIAFKEAMERSPALKNVVMPFTSVAQKEHIPFSVTFSLSRPEVLYQR